MKVLAAGKSTRPALASAPRCECSGNLGHLAIAKGTPTRRRYTDTWGARAASPAAGGAGWRPGASAGTWSQHRAPSLSARGPAGWPAREGEPQPSSTFCSLLFLRDPASLPGCSSSSAFSWIHPPTFFLSVFSLSLFQPRPGLLPGRGAGRPSSSQTPAGTGAGADSIC